MRLGVNVPVPVPVWRAVAGADLFSGTHGVSGQLLIGSALFTDIRPVLRKEVNTGENGKWRKPGIDLSRF